MECKPLRICGSAQYACWLQRIAAEIQRLIVALSCTARASIRLAVVYDNSLKYFTPDTSLPSKDHFCWHCPVGGELEDVAGDGAAGIGVGAAASGDRA